MARPNPSDLDAHRSFPLEDHDTRDHEARIAGTNDNPCTFGAQVKALAQGARTGGIGKQVSAMVHARNAARKAARGARGKSAQRPGRVTGNI